MTDLDDRTITPKDPFRGKWRALVAMVETLHATSLNVDDATDSAAIFVIFPFQRVVLCMDSDSQKASSGMIQWRDVT